MSKIAEQIKKLPDVPGVYVFKKGRQMLYIGKATSLRDRVRSYFRGDIASTRSSWIAKMLELADRVDYIQTDSVLEALLLESQEIKKYQPPFNTREKDDKSYLYMVITDEDYPQVLTVRGKELRGQDRYVFGPFPYGGELREAMKIIRRIFPYRDSKCVPESGKPCFNAQIGLCPGVCAGWTTKEDYRKQIRNLALFFEGKKARVIKNLEKEMRDQAKAQKFEQADEIKKKIFRLQHIHDVALIKREEPSRSEGSISGFRIEAYDIAHIAGRHTVGAMVAMQDGELDKNSYRKFKLKGESAEKSDDTGNLMEVLERRFKHSEWPLPNLIVVDGAQAQQNVVNYILKNHGLTIPVVSVVKDERHKAREILGVSALAERRRSEIIKINAEAHRFAVSYHRQLRGKLE